MSIYVIETTSRFDKEFKKLDRYTQRMIKGWIDKNLVGEENPRPVSYTHLTLPTNSLV